MSNKILKWFNENSNLVMIGIALVILTWIFVYRPACGSTRREPFAPYPDYIGKKLLDMNDSSAQERLAAMTEPTVLLNGVSPSMLEKPAQPVEKWNELLPPDAELENQNFLQPQEFVGIDTVSSSLRNANYDLRSAPPNPRMNTGPWQNSTIEYDPTGI
jgi:hypothetical protein